MTSLIDFYNRFHNITRVQKRLITKSNFTYRQVIRVLERVTKRRNLKILDYGCGSGTLSFYMASRGNDVIGIDVSSNAVKIAKESAKQIGLDKLVKFYTLNGGKKKIKNHSFDLIICIEVIEHVNKDKDLIKFLTKHLNKSGIIIISTPSINAPLYKLQLAKEFDRSVGHLRRYNVEKLVKIFEEVGLNVVEIRKTEGIIRNSLFLFPFLGVFVRFIKGPVSDIVTYIDNLTIPLFGESDLFILGQKL